MRTLKPETWQSADVLALSNLGALLWVVLITIADDEGRVKTDSRHLTVTYLRHAPTGQVQAQLDLMEARRMIRQYEVDGVPCVALLNWKDHQRVDHPLPSKIPPPPVPEPELPLGLDGPSSRALASPRASRASGAVPIRAVPKRTEKDARAVAARVHEAWMAATDTTRAQLTATKLSHVRARLAEGWTEDELVAVVTDGWRNDPWEERVLQNGFATLLRNSSQVEKFLKLARNGAPAIRPRPSNLDLRTAELLREAAESDEAQAAAIRRLT